MTGRSCGAACLGRMVACGYVLHDAVTTIKHLACVQDMTRESAQVDLTAPARRQEPQRPKFASSCMVAATWRILKAISRAEIGLPHFGEDTMAEDRRRAGACGRNGYATGIDAGSGKGKSGVIEHSAVSKT
ncbi:hypothetical protein MESS4_430142 [Mesorhizobium sp. STM 4661]|nr:hypothetical protein MESS4_430142 [Mesorhizobium sp. STM 4661]